MLVHYKAIYNSWIAELISQQWLTVWKKERRKASITITASKALGSHHSPLLASLIHLSNSGIEIV